jgi:hypothetical protein
MNVPSEPLQHEPPAEERILMMDYAAMFKEITPSTTYLMILKKG